MARQFDIGSTMAKLMAVQTSLERLASVEENEKLMSFSVAGSRPQKKNIAQKDEASMPNTRDTGLPDERAAGLPKEWPSTAFPCPRMKSFT